MKQDFEEERRDRENMVSKHSEKFGKWRVRERELIEQLQYGESRLREQAELRQKLEKEHHEIVQALQQQMNEESAVLKEERDIIKAEWNNVANMYEDQKRKYQAELKTLKVEYQHRQSHTEGQLRDMGEQLQCLYKVKTSM